MNPEEVKALLAQELSECEITVNSADGSHFDITVVGDCFAGLSAVKKQQMVYAPINDLITSGAMHAVNIKTFTPEEWDKAAKLRVS